MENNLDINNKVPFHKKFLSEKTGIIFTGIALIVMFLAILIFLIFGNWNFSKVLDESKVGQFGEFIGGVVGSLVALAGIVLYYVALTEQRKDIKINQNAFNLQTQALNLQIREFKAQKEELISTRKIYEQQSKTMKNQQFDSNFYSLLNVYTNIKNILNNSIPNNDYFLSLYNEISKEVIITNVDNIFDTNKKAIECYTNYYINNRGKLSTYFKTIYRLIKFVDNCEHLKEDEKIVYSKIIRSQISDSELLVLCYDYQSIFGIKARPLVLKYKLLKHIQRLSKIEFEKHFNFETELKRNKIVLFIDKLIDLINNNIEKAKDIEIINPITNEYTFDDFGLIIGIYIDVSLELNIIAKNKVSKLPFSEDVFSNFIELVLNDYYYFEKYRLPDIDGIEKIIIKVKENTIFKYTIANI